MISSRSLLWFALVIGMPGEVSAQAQQLSRTLPLVDEGLRVATRDSSSATTSDLSHPVRALGGAHPAAHARSASSRASHVGLGVAVGALVGGLFGAVISSSLASRAEGFA